MKLSFVILTKAKPYTRIKGGKLERVKGYPGKARAQETRMTINRVLELMSHRGMSMDLSNAKYESGHTTYLVSDRYGNSRRMKAKDIMSLLRTYKDTVK